MTDITGVVQKIETRDVAGGKKAYNIVVGGERYGAGLYAPKCKEGDYVKFELDESRGYKNVGRNSLKVNAKGPPPEAVAEAAATAAKAAAPEGGQKQETQETIERQSASNTAIAFLAVAQAADALGLPASGAKGKKLEALDILLEKYATYFYERNTGKDWKDLKPAKTKDEAEVAEGEVDTDDAVAEEAAADTDGWQ